MVWLAEALGNVHQPAEATIQQGAILHLDGARELLDGGHEDEDGGGEEVTAAFKRQVLVLGILTQDRVVPLKLKKYRIRVGGQAMDHQE